MNVCLEGSKAGTVCLGSVASQIHGSEIGMTSLGLGVVGAVALAVLGYVLKA